MNATTLYPTRSQAGYAASRPSFWTREEQLRRAEEDKAASRCDNCGMRTRHFVVRVWSGEKSIICWECREDCGVLFPEER